MKIAFKVFDKDSDGKITTEEVMRIIKELKTTDWLLMEDCQAIIRALNLKSKGKEIVKKVKNMTIDPKLMMMNKIKSHYVAAKRKDSARKASPMLSPTHAEDKHQEEEDEAPFKSNTGKIVKLKDNRRYISNRSKDLFVSFE